MTTTAERPLPARLPLPPIEPGVLISVCSYCGVELRRVKCNSEGFSHGICLDCKQLYIDPQLEAMRHERLG